MIVHADEAPKVRWTAPASRGFDPPPIGVTAPIPGAALEVTRTRDALARLDVDEEGFDSLDRTYLTALLEKFDGGPVGLETLAAAVGEDKGTLEDVVEPFLIHRGFLDRTPRGRVATRRARDHFGIRSESPQGRLL